MISLKMKHLVVNIFVMLLVLVLTSTVHSNQIKTIIIDPGHGGIDGGCYEKGLLEKNITLEIANAIKSQLQNKGYKVLLTRESDISLYQFSKIGTTMPKRDLNERVTRINKSNADLFVSVHVNSFIEDNRINGSVVYFYNTSCLESRNLAKLVQKELNSLSFEDTVRTPHDSRPNDFFILKKTAIPGILIETGFLTSSLEKQWFANESYRQKIAEAISEGIIKYISSSEKAR